MTTFQTRELVRDELVTLFTANGSWQAVYGYAPSVDEIAGQSPILVIRSRGTQTTMAGVLTNPTQYRFSLTNMVIADKVAQTSASAEDQLDTLDRVMRQVIRDNAGGGTYADNFLFEGGFSEVQDMIIGGQAYIVERRFIIASLANGAV